VQTIDRAGAFFYKKTGFEKMEPLPLLMEQSSRAQFGQQKKSNFQLLWARTSKPTQNGKARADLCLILTGPPY